MQQMCPNQWFNTLNNVKNNYINNMFYIFDFSFRSQHNEFNLHYNDHKKFRIIEVTNQYRKAFQRLKIYQNLLIYYVVP